MSLPFKSGRVSPYFFNAGLLNDGEALSLLAQGYADKLVQCENVGDFLVLRTKDSFVAATAVALSQRMAKAFLGVLTVKKPKIMVKVGVLVGASVAGQKSGLLMM